MYMYIYTYIYIYMYCGSGLTSKLSKHIYATDQGPKIIARKFLTLVRSINISLLVKPIQIKSCLMAATTNRPSMFLPSKYTPLRASSRLTVGVFPLFSSGPCGDASVGICGERSSNGCFPSFFIRLLWGFVVSRVRTGDLYDLVEAAWSVSHRSIFMLRTKFRQYLAW